MVYVPGSSFFRVDLEIRLSWEPRSYWMPIEDEPVFTDSTRGMDLLELTLDTETMGCGYCAYRRGGGRGTHHADIL